MKINNIEVKIRRAKKEDISEIFAIGESTEEFKFSRKHFHEKFELREFLKKPKENVFLVATDGKEILGFIYAKIITEDWCMLDNLAVKKEYRQQGIGTALLAELYKILKKEKIDYVQILEEIHHKATRKFWHDKGFREEKVFVWADKKIT